MMTLIREGNTRKGERKRKGSVARWTESKKKIKKKKKMQVSEVKREAI